MTSNDLVALLREARECVRVNCPCCGKANCPEGSEPELSQRIDLALSEPVEELPLREENLALRAALACWRNDEDWRLKYLASELEKGKLKEQLEWAVAVQKAALESQERLALEVKDTRVRYEKALKAARYSLGILASHLDDPNTPWPNYGLKSLAISYKKLVEEIDAVLKGKE